MYKIGTKTSQLAAGWKRDRAFQQCYVCPVQNAKVVTLCDMQMVLTLNASTGPLVSSGNFFFSPGGFSSGYRAADRQHSCGVNPIWCLMCEQTKSAPSFTLCRSSESMRRVTPAETWWISLCFTHGPALDGGPTHSGCDGQWNMTTMARGESAKSGPAQPHWDKLAIFQNFSA